MTSRFFLTTLHAALTRLARNRLRTALSTLGITVSVAAIVTLVSVGQGAQRAVEERVATMGNNVAVVQPTAQRVGSVRTGQGSTVTLTTGDALELKRRIALVRDLCWGRRDPTQVVRGNRNWWLPVVGTNPGCFAVRGWMMAGGQSFTEADMDNNAAVAVLGQTAAERLFDEGQWGRHS